MGLRAFHYVKGWLFRHDFSSRPVYLIVDTHCRHDSDKTVSVIAWQISLKIRLSCKLWETTKCLRNQAVSCFVVRQKLVVGYS